MRPFWPSRPQAFHSLASEPCGAEANHLGDLADAVTSRQQRPCLLELVRLRARPAKALNRVAALGLVRALAIDLPTYTVEAAIILKGGATYRWSKSRMPHQTLRSVKIRASAAAH
jgi:hypothetical protein